MYSHTYVSWIPGVLTGYVFAVYSPWVMSTGSPPPSDRSSAGAQGDAEGVVESQDDRDHDQELRDALERAERQALSSAADWPTEPLTLLYPSDPANQLWVEGEHKRWCGIYGLTKPDEVRLAKYLLHEIDQDFRTDSTLTGICRRWLAVLVKWERKGWWECGVSLRTGWITDKGRTELVRQINTTREREQKMGTEYETELHSTHPDAVAAARSTIEMLGGKLIERDGRWFLRGDTRPAHFVQWAAVQQGYVRGAKPVDSEGFTDEQRKAESRLMATLREIGAKEGRA